VRSVNLSEVQYGVSHAGDYNTTQTIYNATIFGSCSLKFTYIYVLHPTSFSFIGVDIPLSSMSIKVLVEIQHWPFQTIANSLQIIMNTGGGSSSSGVEGCGDDVGFNTLGHLTWYKVYNGEYTLYTPLVNIAKIDQRIEVINFQLNSDNDLIIEVPFFFGLM